MITFSFVILDCSSRFSLAGLFLACPAHTNFKAPALATISTATATNWVVFMWESFRSIPFHHCRLIRVKAGSAHSSLTPPVVEIRRLSARFMSMLPDRRHPLPAQIVRSTLQAVAGSVLTASCTIPPTPFRALGRILHHRLETHAIRLWGIRTWPATSNCSISNTSPRPSFESVAWIRRTTSSISPGQPRSSRVTAITASFPIIVICWRTSGTHSPSQDNGSSIAPRFRCAWQLHRGCDRACLSAAGSQHQYGSIVPELPQCYLRLRYGNANFRRWTGGYLLHQFALAFLVFIKQHQRGDREQYHPEQRLL